MAILKEIFGEMTVYIEEDRTSPREIDGRFNA